MDGQKQGRVALLAWLRAVMKDHGISQAELGRVLGLERQLVNRMLNGKRRLQIAEVEAISRKWGVAPPIALHQSQPKVTQIKVVGEVAAGIWHEMGHMDFDIFEIPYAYNTDSRWPAEALSALIVRGESINRKAQDGDKVVMLDYGQAPRKFRDGDWVVARRERGDLAETTVKQVRGSPVKGWQLWPDSTDPRYQEPIPLDGEFVHVIGFVLDFIKPATVL